MSTEAFRFSGKDAEHYEKYLGPLIFEPSARMLLSELGRFSVRSILETSCGTGRLTRHLRQGFGDEVQLTATDISGDMIAVAKEKLGEGGLKLGEGRLKLGEGGIGFQVADAQQLPFAEGSFDLVVNQYGLMFFPDKQRGVDEAYRVLKPGGHFVFATWDSTTAIPLMKLVIDDHIIPLFGGEDTSRFFVPFSLYDRGFLTHLLGNAGFVNAEVRRVSFSGHAEGPMDVVNGLFLKHPLGREVKEKDAAAVPRIAEALERAVRERFGDGGFDFGLSAWVGVGEKKGH